MDRQQAIIEEFSRLPDWDARYKHIIQLGKALPPMEAAYQVDANKVQGCQSTVWMFATLNPDGTVHYQADSDALIVKGLIALVLRVYNDLPAPEIVATAPDFLEKIEMGKHLSMQRSNGLAAMLKQMKLYAMAFQLRAGM